MDTVSEIKARLSIEELVGQYCQLQKKGRSLVALCPFHNDSHPSFLISPEKGIAYCFACQKGGDIFSVYQLLEHVDFPQAVNELAEKVGVIVERRAETIVKKDEKERLRQCLEEALIFYRKSLRGEEKAIAYVEKRGIPSAMTEDFELGFAPDGVRILYEHLLKRDYERAEILSAGLAMQRELDGSVIDRFRNRLMFPIRDSQGKLLGFGGRTLGDDPAKYINSAESPLYQKAQVLYGLSRAREAMRVSNAVTIVEGYIDVIACHSVGIKNAVATCGTALTEQQVRLLKRYVKTAVLCLDNDAAGQAAANRAFGMLAPEGFEVRSIVLPSKDPGDLMKEDPVGLATILEKRGSPYIESVIACTSEADRVSIQGRKKLLDLVLPLLASIPSATERSMQAEKISEVLKSPELTQTVILRDIDQLRSMGPHVKPKQESPKEQPVSLFSGLEIVLGLFLHYPRHIHILRELVEPIEPFSRALYAGLMRAAETRDFSLNAIDLAAADKERAAILMLFCDDHDMAQWSDAVAQRELLRNVQNANREILRKKQQDIARQLALAHASGNMESEANLTSQYRELLERSKVVK